MSDDFANSVNEQAIEASNMVLKTLIILHGGASIGLLAFLGNLIGKSPPLRADKVANVAMSITSFGWGIVAAVVAMVLAYATHYLTVATQWGREERRDDYRAGKTIIHGLAICLTTVSLILFVCGMFSVRDSIIQILD
ncbi:hypothetical protein KRR38_25065 [Novosphingobium sp. G106]|uniref:hypothetical protein n=1 Tax=Novosphingobium sp. G106 TaxID=2849500 RepID=UPI001C2D7A07|nr:hypothetical protein [Novosphingobium sp. G106]MBV1690859.1 hypothetical protein [Novosphingobium sp. G106]